MLRFCAPNLLLALSRRWYKAVRLVAPLGQLRRAQHYDPCFSSSSKWVYYLDKGVPFQARVRRRVLERKPLNLEGVFTKIVAHTWSVSLIRVDGVAFCSPDGPARHTANYKWCEVYSPVAGHSITDIAYEYINETQYILLSNGAVWQRYLAYRGTGFACSPFGYRPDVPRAWGFRGDGYPIFLLTTTGHAERLNMDNRGVAQKFRNVLQLDFEDKPPPPGSDDGANDWFVHILRTDGSWTKYRYCSGRGAYLRIAVHHENWARQSRNCHRAADGHLYLVKEQQAHALTSD